MPRVLLHFWCGPRCLSTATMYSFAQRPDTTCCDEPLYPAWLKANPHKFRPYRDDLLSSSDTDGNSVLRSLLSHEGDIVFAKNIARQVTNLDRDLILGLSSTVIVRHVFLFRDPLDMISCWEAVNSVHNEGCTLEATCYPQMVQLFSEIQQLACTTGSPPPICIDSTLLKHHPDAVLQALCRQLDIPFYKDQLTWEPGPKAYDGMWAKYWYNSVHLSSGFTQTETEGRLTYRTLDPAHLELYRQALPFYDLLKRHALGIDPIQPAATHPAFTLLSPCPSIPDVRNENVLVWVGNRLVPREMALISVFDSAVQGGDAVWEGLRVYQGRIFKLDEHLNRLTDSAKAMAFAAIPSIAYIQDAIFKTLAINGMRDGCHIRLTLSRGCKVTSSMNPLFNLYGCNVLVVPEWKAVGGAATYDNSVGVTLITATNRRNSPQCVDSKIHHCNLINNILPKIQANLCGAADALMLDVDGFISETNATNVFIVKDGHVSTPDPSSCLPGITRLTVMNICRGLGITCLERRISLAEAHCADELFTTGTMGELTPVTLLDGRVIGDGVPGKVLERISQVYRHMTQTEGTPLPF